MAAGTAQQGRQRMTMTPFHRVHNDASSEHKTHPSTPGCFSLKSPTRTQAVDTTRNTGKASRIATDLMGRNGIGRRNANRCHVHHDKYRQRYEKDFIFHISQVFSCISENKGSCASCFTTC